MLDSHFLVVDVETTGLSTKLHSVISVACVLFDKHINEIAARHFYTFADPNKKISPDAVKINGYSHEAWQERGAIPLKVGLLSLRSWTDQLPAFYTMAHNAPFDLKFILAAEEEHKVDTGLPRRWIDTKQLFADYNDWRQVNSRTDLDTYCEMVNYKRGENHEALEDCRIAGSLYKYIMEQTNWELEPVLTREQAMKVIVPFGRFKGQPLIAAKAVPRYWDWMINLKTIPTRLRVAMEILES